MIRACRVKWVPNEKPIITICVNKFEQKDITWSRHQDNYTATIGPLLLSWYRQSKPQLEIQTEKKFNLTDGTVEILTNPYVGAPYLDKFNEDLCVVQYTFDMQMMRDSKGQIAFVKPYQLNGYLKEGEYDWRVGVVQDNVGRKRIEAVKYAPGVFDGPLAQEYSEKHEVIKVYGEWNDDVKL